MIEIIYKNISELKPYEKNPRKNKSAVKKVSMSIKEYGFKIPLVIDKDNVVVCGHTRLLAAEKLKIEKVPCIIASDLTPEQIKAFRIADNKVTEEADWNKELLTEELRDLLAIDYDLSLTGFDKKDLDFLLTDIEAPDEDFNPDEEAPVVCQVGDLWFLGEHRLLVGDSTLEENFKILMEDDKADLVITDPPYNVNYESKAGKIQNDNMSKATFYDFLLSAFTNIAKFMDDKASIYVFHADTEGLNFRKAFDEAGFHLSNCCIWSKNSLVLGRSPYQWQHEPILYGWKNTGKHEWYAGRKEATIWNFDRPTKSKDHPTMKPVDLLCYPIKNSSKKGDLILDPFGGSGSTLIACETTERRCRTIELDTKYADKIISRFAKLKGTEKIKVHRSGQEISYEKLLKFCN